MSCNLWLDVSHQQLCIQNTPNDEAKEYYVYKRQNFNQRWNTRWFVIYFSRHSYVFETLFIVLWAENTPEHRWTGMGRSSQALNYPSCASSENNGEGSVVIIITIIIIKHLTVIPVWRYSLIFKPLSKIYQYKPHNRYSAQPHLVVRFLMWIYLKNSGEFSIHWSFCKLRWYSAVHLNLRDTNTGSWNTIHGLTLYLVPITSTLDLT